MARKGSWNPFAFLPTQVSIGSGIVYAASLAALLVVHHTIPPPPTSTTPIDGVNLTQAWLDLEYITNGFHPWGSRRNDEVREYLLARVGEILTANKVEHDIIYASGEGLRGTRVTSDALVTVFANDTSNSTSLDDWGFRPLTLYSESQNLLVYIRGERDTAGDWWNDTKIYDGTSGVLVNAHYDSVASGYGATDDGVGVVTILQLISHFSSKGNQPKRGIVALLNNGEENGLYGARNYVRHPASQLPHTFLNLEGAGAGGRAMLFRSTDAEVTKAYAKSPYPFGSVISGDGFKRGLVRSGTDFSVFTQELGLRGLDVSFYAPRARYHTDQDGARDTSRASLWHMLSASLATMQDLTSYDGDTFEGEYDKNGKLHTGASSDAVWFDMFGRTLAVLKLHDLFALSVTLLVAGPVFLIVLEVLIRRSDKWYPLAGTAYLHSSDDDESVRLHGRRGFFRFPVACGAATGAVVALAYLLTKLNPYIMYSSQYVVWAMMLSAFFTAAWVLLAAAAAIRPTALHRMFILVWSYVLTWVLLVLATIGEHKLAVGGGYFILIYNFSVFAALLISYLELFALPKKSKYVETTLGQRPAFSSDRPASQSSRQPANDTDNGPQTVDEADADESTSLLGGRSQKKNAGTFSGIVRSRTSETAHADEVSNASTAQPSDAYRDEQPWSSSLPQWTWILQFIILAPINVILVGQIALLTTSALHQTPADGNDVFPVYLTIALLTVLLILPLLPFLHRFTHHIPVILILVFLGCLAYNLLAFPFSRDARLKVYFVQDMNLDDGHNSVSIAGVAGYLEQVIAEMPSAAGQDLNCSESQWVNRQGLQSCSWYGLPPNVVPQDYTSTALANNVGEEITYKDWIDYNITTPTASTASFSLRGLNTKMCRLVFDNAVSSVEIEDAGSDPRQRPVGEEGSRTVTLLSRTRDKLFHVTVGWVGQSAKGQTGKVVCMYDDANESGTIPAFDELRRFAPTWSVATKSADGLFEGWKGFVV